MMPILILLLFALSVGGKVMSDRYSKRLSRNYKRKWIAMSARMNLVGILSGLAGLVATFVYLRDFL